MVALDKIQAALPQPESPVQHVIGQNCAEEELHVFLEHASAGALHIGARVSLLEPRLSRPADDEDGE